MRPVAKTLLVLLVMGGLVLPKTMARFHEVTCETPEACHEPAPIDLADLLPADDCPLDEWPVDIGHCGGHLHHHNGENHPSHPHHHHHGGKDGTHHHHHHHQCACSAANAWLIAEGDPLSLHPPHRGRALAASEFLFAPESPVYLLDRPPMA